jgi:hypothetical protein
MHYISVRLIYYLLNRVLHYGEWSKVWDTTDQFPIIGMYNF